MPTTTAPVEKKVKAATVAAYLASTALLMILTTVQDQPGLVDWLPPYLAPWLLALLPTAVTFVSGYQTEHTPRTEPPATQPPAQDGPLG